MLFKIVMNIIKRVFIIILLSLSIFSCSKDSSLPQEALARYINAKIAYQRGNLEKAFQEFNEISTDYKNFKEAGLMAGKSAFFLGRYQEAEIILSKIWAKMPEYYDAGYWLGRTCIMLQKNNEAMEIFISLHKNNSTDFRVLHQMALLRMEKGDLLTSIDYLKQGLMLRDELAQTALTLTKIYYSQGLIEEAQTFLSEAREISVNEGSVGAAIDEMSKKINKEVYLQDNLPIKDEE